MNLNQGVYKFIPFLWLSAATRRRDILHPLIPVKFRLPGTGRLSD
jgi:hypothetical protein